jgi:hypothetical protein
MNAAPKPRPIRPMTVADRLRELPLERDPHSVRARVEAMEHLLEGLVRVPVLGRKFGLDVILDLVPGVGPAVAAALGGWMLWEARNLGMSRWQMARMTGNIALDGLLSAIPWLGAIPDLFYRSNTRNLRIIRRHLDRHHPGTVLIGR